MGYAQKDTLASGNAMLAAQFASVSATDGSATLSDLTIGGYDAYDPKEDEGGTSGDFKIMFLTSSGTTAASYSWFDDDEKTGWFDANNEDAGNVEIPAGTGVWTRGMGMTVRIPAPEL